MKEESLKKNTDDVESNATQPGVANSGRRHFSKLGFTAPVFLSLASRPVLAGNCLSNILSGNLSDPTGGNCQLGWSPRGWRSPRGEVNNHPTLNAWEIALGMNSGPNGEHPYGELPSPGGPFPQGYPSDCERNNGRIRNRRGCYIGGFRLSDTMLASCYGGDNRPLRQILHEDRGSEKWHCVAAYLNAKLSENDPSFNYILTTQQVVDLCCGNQPVPGGWGLNEFLDFTWDGSGNDPHGSVNFTFPS